LIDAGDSNCRLVGKVTNVSITEAHMFRPICGSGCVRLSDLHLI
jgi:hypothetical protein